MAEEWGVLIIKVDTSVAEAFLNCGDSLNEPMKQLASIAGLDFKILWETLSAEGSIEVKDQYVQFTYDCAKWLAFSEYVFNQASGIEFYACHGDEYGTVWLFSLAADATRFHLLIETDEDEFEDERRIGINRWIQSLPEAMVERFPDIIPFEPEEYIGPGDD